MRTLWRARCCVPNARFFIASILLFSIVVQTRQQQREIKSKWDNRLLPTNSVYEKSQEFVAPLGTKNSKGIENTSSYENENNEEIYDEDYELDDTNENDEVTMKKISTAPLTSPRGSNGHQHERDDKTRSDKKLSLESSRETLMDHEDDAYYYYDDYENVTSPENDASERVPVDYFDSSEDATIPSAPGEPERTSESPMDEKLADSSIEESSKNSTLKSISINEKLTESRDEKVNDEETHELHDVNENNEKIVKSHDDEKINDKSNSDDEILIGEAVVSVVTTKSVVNGTISVPVSPEPMTTEQIISPIIPSTTANPIIDLSNENSTLDETTEDSRIVASVQTSRSISGARFLPFLVVETPDVNSSKKTDNITKDEKQSIKIDDFSGKVDNNDEKSINDETTKNNDEVMGISLSTTNKSLIQSESTESIIDKLDRVQSELSSGFLANGFRTSGNTLQLDVLSEQRPPFNRKTFTTTSRTPVISKFVPRRYNQEKKTSTTTAATTRITETSLDEEITGIMEKVKFRWPSSSRNSRPATTESHYTFNDNKNHNIRDFGTNGVRKFTTQSSTSGSAIPDISAFLPPGYQLKKDDDTVTEKSLLGEILAKSKIDISSLLPANYNAREVKKTPLNMEDEKREKGASNEKNLTSLFDKPNIDVSSLLPVGYKPVQNVDVSTTEKFVKPEKSLQDLFSKPSVDISALLPPGYNRFKAHDITEKTTSSRATETTRDASTLSMGTTPRTSGGIKLVFPSRPGGRKASSKSTTTVHSSRLEGSGPVTPKIQKGWPTRATTEFTGWPAPSTTPISIEKLLEAARTATVASTNVSVVTMTQTPSTTSTSTTTTTTPRPTTPGICEDECEVAGTIRIVDNATWVPELLDRNTQEWQQLAEEIEKEMNLVFVKSSVLRKWYKRIRIDAFSPGSILVDYFIELIDIPQRINTQELKVIFHDSLRTYNSDRWNETRAKGPIRLGPFALDPKSTDFVVVPKVSFPQYIEADDRLIPQWAIAVIVIGVGGLLFIIVFGVSVLVNRQNAAKLKPSPVVYTEEVAKNIIQASHGATSHRSSQDYPKSDISTIWNDTDVWRDKSFESNSNEVLVDGTLGRERNTDRRSVERKYNMYDSWRSEWNGYYYNPSQSSKFAGYESTNNLSRHPPDYDTNF